MRSAMSCCLSAVTAVTLFGAAAARADVLLYSFETGDTPNAVDGFTRNGGPSSFTVTQSTTGVTAGSNSGLFTVTPAGFAGAITTKIDPIFSSTTNTPTAVTASLTVPAGFVYTGTNAPFIGITIFGTLPDPGDPTTPAAAQFQVVGASERPIPFSTAGVMSNVSIPLIGFDPVTGAAAPYSQALAEGFLPTSFQFFFDKNAPITVAIDNVIAVAPTAVVPEPASLAAIAVGAGALLRRRRA